MSNVTIISICFAALGVCVVLSGFILIVLGYLDFKKCSLDKVVKKLQELNDSVSCGPRFCKTKYISVEWLLNYIEEIQK